jgi:hypothetical protein
LTAGLHLGRQPGVNPTIDIFSLLQKHSRNASVVVVNTEVAGVAPGGNIKNEQNEAHILHFLESLESRLRDLMNRPPAVNKRGYLRLL